MKELTVNYVISPGGKKEEPTTASIEWIGTVLSIAGALMIASNTDWSKYAFLLFVVGSFAWTAAGVRRKNSRIVVLNLFFFGINILGVARWLF